MKAFLRWWLLFCLYGIGSVILYKLGLFSDLYEADASKLSFLIIAIFSGAQLFALGIFGEYLASIHFRTMDRPPYVVDQVINKT